MKRNAKEKSGLFEKREKNRRVMERRRQQRRGSERKKEGSNGCGIFTLFNIFIAAFICASVVFCANEGYVYATTSPHFLVAVIEVHGLEEVERGDLLKVSGLHIGENTFLLDLKEICLKLQEVAWIKDASITRELPDTLIINIHERTPFAIAQSDELYLVDREGVVLRKIKESEEHAYPVIAKQSGLLPTDGVTVMSEAFVIARDLLSVAHSSAFIKPRGIKQISVGKGNKVKVHINGENTPFYFDRFDFSEGIQKLDAMEELLAGKEIEKLDLSYRHQVVVKFICDTRSKKGCQNNYSI